MRENPVFNCWLSPSVTFPNPPDSGYLSLKRHRGILGTFWGTPQNRVVHFQSEKISHCCTGSTYPNSSETRD